MAKKLFLPIGLGLLAVVAFLVALPRSIVSAQSTSPIAVFRVAWEQYDFTDGSNTSTFQGNMLPTMPYTVAVWDKGVLNTPQIFMTNTLGGFYTYTVNAQPWNLQILGFTIDHQPMYFSSQEIHNAAVTMGSPDCPRRSDPYTGVIWQVQLDDLSVGPTVTLENRTPNVYYKRTNVPYIGPSQKIEPWTTYSWSGVPLMGVVEIYAFDANNDVWNPLNPVCGYVEWDFRSLVPPTPTPTATATSTVTPTPTTTATPTTPTVTPTSTATATPWPTLCVGFCQMTQQAPTATATPDFKWRLYLSLVQKSP